MVQETAGSRIAVLVLVAGCFTTGLNVGVLSPLVKAIGHDFVASDAVVGQAAALHALVAGLTALLVAPWVDRFPRRTVLRVECLLLLAATALSAFAPTLLWLFVGRGLAGLGGAVIAATCFAAVGDLFPDPARRNRVIGLLSASFSLATIAGLTLITQVADLAGWRWALAALLVPTALVLVGSAWLPTTTASTADGQRAVGYRAVLGHAQVNWLLAVVIVLCMVWAGWVVYFGAFTATVFAAGATALSLLFLVGGAAELLASQLTPLLLRRCSGPAIFTAFTLLVTVSLVSVSFVSGAWWLVLPFVVLLSLGGTVLYLTATVLLLDALPTARGAVMALQTGCFELGWAGGTALTGAALATLDGYGGTYQLLGLLLPLSLLFLALSVRRTRAATATASPLATPLSAAS